MAHFQSNMDFKRNNIIFLTGFIPPLLPTHCVFCVARINSGIPPTMNSEDRCVPGESKNCQETLIEFNQKEIKGGVFNRYKLTSLRNKVNDNKIKGK
jgi:hypothetical protein